MTAEVLMSTKDMSRADWLEARRKGIGGSDAPVILGLSKWKTAFELWLEKTGQVELEETSSEAAYWGTKLEEIVADEFAVRTGKKVRRRNAILQHPQHKWMLADVDRVVIGERALLECKATSAWLQNEWKDDEIPDAYIIQPQHYMAVTGVDKVYIAVLIGGNQFKYKEIPRDEELINMIIDAERHFWEFNVKQLNPPVLDGSSLAEKFLNERYAKTEPGKVIDLPASYKEKIELHRMLKSQIKTLDEQVTAIEVDLKQRLETAEVGLVGGYAVNWKSVESKRIDTQALKKAWPGIYMQYSKPTISRRFEIKEVR